MRKSRQRLINETIFTLPLPDDWNGYIYISINYINTLFRRRLGRPRRPSAVPRPASVHTQDTDPCFQITGQDLSTLRLDLFRIRTNCGYGTMCRPYIRG